MLMGLRGISLFGAAGDGGNHFSFGAFIAIGENATLAKTLNQVSCNYSMPTFPAASPYVTAVGGLQMQPSNTSGSYPFLFIIYCFINNIKKYLLLLII